LNFENKVRESFSRQSFMRLIGAKLINVSPGYCEIHLPYKKELSQQHGFFHAGIIGTIADNSGGYAAYSLIGAESHRPLTRGSITPIMGGSIIPVGDNLRFTLITRHSHLKIYIPISAYFIQQFPKPLMIVKQLHFYVRLGYFNLRLKQGLINQ
jgi:hypothetical protein